MKTPQDEGGELEQRGWWYPQFLVDLYASRSISAEEFLLLGKINSYKKCWIGNRALGKWWGGKSLHWVSRSLSKLQEKGLIKVTETDRGDRLISTCFAGDEGYKEHLEALSKKTKGFVLKDKGGCPKRQSHLSRTDSRTESSSADADSPSSELGSNGVSKYFEDNTPVDKLCLRYHEFIIKKGWDLVPFKGKMIHNPPKINNWRAACQLLLKKEDAGFVREVMQWYFENWSDQWTGKRRCTITTFCRDFEDIVMSKSRIEKRKSGDDGRNDFKIQKINTRVVSVTKADPNKIYTEDEQ